MNPIKIFKKIKNQPADKSWLEKGESDLRLFLASHTAVRNEAPVRQVRAEGFFKSFIFKPMPIATIILAAILATGGGVVSASQNSLPTDVLYPVKIAVENVREVLTFDQGEKAALSMKAAGERIKEMQALQAKNQLARPVLEKTLASYQNSITEAQNHLSAMNAKESGTEKAGNFLVMDKTLSEQQTQIESLSAKVSSAEQPIQIIYLNTKFNLSVGSWAVLNKTDFKIKLINAFPVITAPQVCKQGDCPDLLTIAPAATITVESREKIEKYSVYLGQVINMGEGFYFQLMGVEKGNITGLIFFKSTNDCAVPVYKCPLPNTEPEISGYDGSNCPIYKCPPTPPTTCNTLKCEDGYYQVKTGEYDKNNCPVIKCVPLATCNTLLNCAQGFYQLNTGEYDKNNCPVAKCVSNETSVPIKNN